MGYLWDADKTDLLIDSEGWVHSGDLGRTDEEGFFYVTGRIKVNSYWLKAHDGCRPRIKTLFQFQDQES